MCSITVYGITCKAGIVALYKNRGSAVDAMPQFYAPDYRIKTFILPVNDNTEYVFGAVNEKGEQIWFDSESAATASGLISSKYEIEESVKAFPKNHLFRCIIEKDDEGFYTRINSHPELCGTQNAGKIYRPDEDWKDIQIGYADVIIVKDDTSAAVVTGTMVPMKAPAKPELAKFLREGFVGNLDVTTIGCCELGSNSYVYVNNGTELHTCYSIIDGEFQKIHNFSGRELWTISARKLLLQDTYGNKLSAVEKFLHTASIPQWFFSKSNANHVKFVRTFPENETIDRALQSALIVGYSEGSNMTFGFTKELQILCRYSFEELSKVFEAIFAFRKHNTLNG